MIASLLFQVLVISRVTVVDLIQAGLTPMEALRTATSEPARYLAVTDSLGSVAPGRLADFVRLAADPLSDIRNTRRVVAVVANGRVSQKPTGETYSRPRRARRTRSQGAELNQVAVRQARTSADQPRQSGRRHEDPAVRRDG